MQDLQSFFADQRPDAVNSTFKVISVEGKSASIDDVLYNVQSFTFVRRLEQSESS